MRRSDDGGKTWTTSLVLERAAAAYSSLARMGDGRLGVLFERADHIAFATIASTPDGPLGEF